MGRLEANIKEGRTKRSFFIVDDLEKQMRQLSPLKYMNLTDAINHCIFLAIQQLEREKTTPSSPPPPGN